MRASSQLAAIRCVLVATSIVAFAAACDDSTSLSPQERVAKAEELLRDGDLNASIIHLKNALRADPKLGAARLMLGKAYVDMGDPAGAEKELLRARDLGIAEDEWAKPLGDAWIMLGKYQQVLGDLPATDDANTPPGAPILALHGDAFKGLGRLEDAERAYKAALADTPTSTDGLVGLIRLEMQRGDLARAKDLLARALEVGANDPKVLLAKGDIHLASNELKEAESAYRQLVETRKWNPTYRLYLAYALIANNEVDKAVQHIEALLKRSPKHPRANYLRALAAYRMSDYQLAKQFGEQALAVAPDYPPSLLLAGAASYALRQYQQADNYLDGYLARNPSNVIARKLAGATKIQLGRAAEALSTITPLLQDSVADAQLLAMAGDAAVATDDLRAGVRHFERAAQLRPADADIRARLGVVRASLGDVEQGVGDLEKALDLNPDLDAAMVSLFTVHMRARRYAQALEVGRRLQESRSDLPVGYTMEGLARLAMGETESARAQFLKALDIKPGALDASANLALLDAREGNPDAARNRLLDAAKHNPGNIRPLLMLASLEQGQENWGAAIEHLEHAVATAPSSLEPRLLLAQIHLNRGNPEKALAVTETLVQQHSDNTGLLALVGRAQLAAKRPNDAAGTFRLMVSAQPDSAATHYLLATAYRAMGDRIRYREELDKALAIDPQLLPAKIGIAEVLGEQGDIDAAERMLGELKQAASDNSAILELEALIAMARGRNAEAAQILETIHERVPSSDLATKLARARWLAGDPDGSAEVLERWLEGAPRDYQVRYTLAGLQISRGNLEAARTNLREIINLAPDYWPAQNNMAWVLWRLGEAKAALPHVERSLALAQDDPSVLDTAGVVLLETGEVERAVRLLRRADERLPGNPGIQYHLAQARAKQGSTEEARRILRDLLARDVNFPEKDEAKALLTRLGG